MDNKLTKRRLSDFLAYEWIVTIIVAVAAIIVWELVYTVSAARLSCGQQFKYYLDEDLYSFDSYSVYDLLEVSPNENGKTFSYDILSVETENLISSYNVLSVRLSIQEGDAIFTSAEEREDERVRAKTIIDQNPVYDFEELYSGAKEYLAQFTVGGGNVFNENDYDEAVICEYFDKRMKGDNRYRTEAEKAEGRQNEIGRIKKLAKDVKDFGTVLAAGAETELFYRYTKYEQAAGGDAEDKDYGAVYAKELEKGAKIYGVNMAALTGGRKNVSEYLKIQGKENADKIVLVLFDFSSYQYDLQFESISFVNTLVREFSDILG